MRWVAFLLALSVASAIADPKESILLDTRTKEVVNPLVIFPSGHTLECDGCTLIGFSGLGANSFTELNDVPNSYSGAALKGVRVNAAANALEFYTITASGVTSITATSPIVVTPSPITSTGAISLDETANFSWTGQHTFTRSTASIIPLSGITIGHNADSGTPGSGFGSILLFKAEDSTTDDVGLGSVSAQWVDATDGSATSKISLGGLLNAGSTTAGIMTLFGTGGVAFDVDGSTTDPGAGYLSVATGFKIGATPLPFAGGTTGQVLTKASNTDYDWVWSANPTPTATATATPTPTATASATATATPTATPTASIPHIETLVVNGGGIVLGTGAKAPDKLLHVSGTIKKWSMICSPSGSVTADILRAANGAGLPVTSIIGGTGTKPFISAGIENTGTDFTNWTSNVLADGDNITISLSGITDVTYVQLKLWFDE